MESTDETTISYDTLLALDQIALRKGIIIGVVGTVLTLLAVGNIATRWANRKSRRAMK
jgi:hypothetical protein